MATTTKTTETLARKSGSGPYDMGWVSRLVRRGDKHYVVHDQFCGMDSLEGGANRPFVYAVPADRVEEVRQLYAEADEFVDPDRPELGTNWRYLELFILPELVCAGRASRLRWARDL